MLEPQSKNEPQAASLRTVPSRQRQRKAVVDQPQQAAVTSEPVENLGSRVIRNVQIQTVPNKRLFGVAAAAKYLGISDDTLRKYADLEQIPVYRFINGHRAFKLEDLNRLIDDLPLWNHRSTSDTARAGRVEEVS